MNNRRVEPVGRKQCESFVLVRHYAHRWPSVSFLFGLFVNGEIEGICLYGTPPSAPLRRGIAGPDYQNAVLELNRLCLRTNRRNDASYLVSHSLKLLPPGKIIVSFADISQGHTGYAYQASNFIYTGLSAKRTDWKIQGMEHLHGQTVADRFRGHPSRAQKMREAYGNGFYLAPRARKHRYVYFHGNKRFRREALAALRYRIQPYPKGNSCER